MSNLEPNTAPRPQNTPASTISAANEPLSRPLRFWRRRAQYGLGFTLIGLLIFLVGARPSIFGLDRSPVIGFVQIAVFLIGLGIISISGYLALTALWGDTPTSIAADIGSRLVATGYIISVFAGMADIFGLGSQPLPQLPFFGPWQARGVEAGELIIAVGFLLLLPFKFGESSSHTVPPETH